MDTSLSPTSVYDNELQNIQQKYISVGGSSDKFSSDLDHVIAANSELFKNNGTLITLGGSAKSRKPVPPVSRRVEAPLGVDLKSSLSETSSAIEPIREVLPRTDTDSSPTREGRVAGPTREASVAGPTKEVRVPSPAREVRDSAPTKEVRVPSPAREVRDSASLDTFPVTDADSTPIGVRGTIDSWGKTVGIEDASSRIIEKVATVIGVSADALGKVEDKITDAVAYIRSNPLTVATGVAVAAAVVAGVYTAQAWYWSKNASVKSVLGARLKLLLNRNVTVGELNAQLLSVKASTDSEIKKAYEQFSQTKNFYMVKIEKSDSTKFYDIVDEVLLVNTIVSVCYAEGKDWMMHKTAAEAIKAYSGVDLSEELYARLFTRIHVNPVFETSEIESLTDKSAVVVAKKFNDVSSFLASSDLYKMLFNEKLNSLGVSHKNLSELKKGVAEYLNNSKSILDSLRPKWKSEIVDDLKSLIRHHDELSAALLYLDTSRFSEVNAYRALLGGSAAAPVRPGLDNKTVGNRVLRLLMRLTYLINIYRGIIESYDLAPRSYGVSSQPYLQAPILSDAEKAGLRQLMSELNDISRLISFKVLDVSQKQLPPYSMLQEMERIGYELDDRTLNSVVSDEDMATRLEKYIKYLTKVTESLTIYYTAMHAKNGDVSLKIYVNQLKELQAQLENALKGTLKSKSALLKEIGDFFKMKRVVKPATGSKFTTVQYGGGDAKQKYVLIGGHLKSLTNSEEMLLNVMNRNINVISQHVNRL